MNKTFDKHRGIIDRLFNSRNIPVELLDEELNSLYVRPYTENRIFDPKILERHKSLVDRKKIIILNEIVDYFYAFMKVENGYVIIGPSSSGSLEFIPFQNLYKDIISSTEIVRLYEMVEFAPYSNMLQFGNMISMIYELFTGNCVEVTELIDVDFFDSFPNELMKITRYSNNIMDRKRCENIIYMERTMKSVITAGNVASLWEVRKLLRVCFDDSISPQNIGSEQYIFIPAITVASRAAIAGGAPIYDSFKLTNKYVRRFNEISGVREMVDLLNNATEDFCLLVADSRNVAIRPEVCDMCEKYIHDHLYEKILIADLAEYCQKSVRQLQRLFKEFYKCSFSEYVLNCKLEKAELLVFGTNSSISEICRRMGFESQSYFTKKFLEKYGKTPGDYRKYKNLDINL